MSYQYKYYCVIFQLKTQFKERESKMTEQFKQSLDDEKRTISQLHTSLKQVSITWLFSYLAKDQCQEQAFHQISYGVLAAFSPFDI